MMLRIVDYKPITLKPCMFALLFIILVMLVLWVNGKKENFIPCVADCGETFVAEKQVKDFQLYAFKYGLFQNHATSNDINAHPFLYTHNVSIPSIIFPLLDWWGVKQFWERQLLTLFVFGAGLFYAFLATLYHTRSYIMASVLLFFFVTDYYHVFSFGLNALRVWHWLVLFGLIFHGGRYFLERNKFPRLDRLMIAFFSFLAFGIGYDFWVICLLVVMALGCLTFIAYPQKLGVVISDIFLISLFFAIPVILRQIHAIIVLGTDFWFYDFIYSAAIKAPILKNVFDLPPMAEIEHYYKLHNIVRAPATPGAAWSTMWTTMFDMLKFVVMPSFGIFSIALVLVVFTFSLMWYVYSIIKLFNFSIRELERKLQIFGVTFVNDFYFIRGGLRLFLALIIGGSIGLLIFAPLTFHVYFKHQFPLLAAPVFLAKAIVFMITYVMFFTLFIKRSKKRWIVLSLIVFLFMDHVIIQINNIKYFKSISTSWISEVQARKNSTFAVSWVSDTLSPYTDKWVVGLTPGIESKVLERLHNRKRPFEFSDYFLFGQQDMQAVGDGYLMPDYWVYFPIDQSNQFDSPSPIRNNEYLSNFLSFFSNTKPKALYLNDIRAYRFTPGGYIVLYGLLENTKANINKIELVSEGKVLAKFNYNSIYGTFSVVYRTPDYFHKEYLPLTAVAIYNGGKKTILGEVRFHNLPGYKVEISDIDSSFLRHKQMTVDEIISANPNITIAARGFDYVIFDMRKIYTNAQ